MLTVDELAGHTFLTKVGKIASLSAETSLSPTDEATIEYDNATYCCCPEAEELVIDSLPRSTRARKTKSVIMTYRNQAVALRKMSGEKSTYALRTVQGLGIIAGGLYATTGAPKPHLLPRITEPSWRIECEPNAVQFHFLRTSMFLVTRLERQALFLKTRYESILTATNAAKTLATHHSIVTAADTALSSSRPVASASHNK